MNKLNIFTHAHYNELCFTYLTPKEGWTTWSSYANELVTDGYIEMGWCNEPEKRTLKITFSGIFLMFLLHKYHPEWKYNNASILSH